MTETEQCGNVRNTVRQLLAKSVAKTHVSFILEQGARQLIQESTLIPEARDFLLDIIQDDVLEVTLHASEEEEKPYSEVFVGCSGSLRGLQCYTVFDQEVVISPRQTYDPNTHTPISPESCRALNKRLNQDSETAINITKGVLEATADLLEKRPAGFKIAQLL